MIWIRYADGGRVRHGTVDGHLVVEGDGDPYTGFTPTGRTLPLASVRLEVPTVPGTFFAMGANYRDHILRRAAVTGARPVIPERAEVGYRANNALIPHGEPIIQPADAGPLQYEGELVAVFGRAARRVRAEDALDYILGWTIGNDVTERSWQAADRTMWRSKNSDTFKPMGPWIVTDLDPAELTTTIRVNGEVTDQFATANMLFSVAECVAEITRYVTIQPGDVLWLGTDGLPRDVQAGDTVEIEISGIGTLRNPIVRMEQP